ncbi:hypothetical protein BASA81_006639 [Batrachochytrium salamandrivorans]|nr:hypothetical protein BASA81_006639 [Batrachochytrium salamandrivorans]
MRNRTKSRRKWPIETEKAKFAAILQNPAKMQLVLCAESQNRMSRVQTLADALNRPAPVDNDGEWVRFAEFVRRGRGKKSFGYYECSQCTKGWMSAHARVDYRQECKTCPCLEWPMVMWVNAPGAVTKERSPEKERKHHMAHLCEACCAGELCMESLWI